MKNFELKILRKEVQRAFFSLSLFALFSPVAGLAFPEQEVQEHISPEQASVFSDFCLDLLQPSEEPRSTTMLGRVFWQGRILEPALIEESRKAEKVEFSFRNCSGSYPTVDSIEITEWEPYDNALVARFTSESPEPLTTYSETLSGRYEPNGEAMFLFEGSGNMLKVHRLDEEHIEVTGTNSVQIRPLTDSREAVPDSNILLVGTRQAMTRLETEVWEQPWGNEPEDSKILRGIKWWELVRPRQVRVHQTVEDFVELAQQIEQAPSEKAVTWNSQLEEDLRAIVSGDTFALLVVEVAEDINMAEIIFAQSENGNAEFDVSTLEELWDEDGDEYARLKKVSTRGRFVPLVRLYDLAAIMPDRIAGKVRRNYLEKHQILTRNYVVLKANSNALHFGNAIFQDQAVEMEGMVRFLGCMLQIPDEKQSRREVLRMGLEKMNIPFDGLEGKDMSGAFHYLFQGFSLPPGLRAGERSFLGALSSGDPTVLDLLTTLQRYLDSMALDSEELCKVVLIPDAVSRGEWDEETLMVVPSLSKAPADHTEAPMVMSENSLYDQAQAAKDAAREALKAAIYARGAKHTKRMIQRGHEQLDRGNALLQSSQGTNEQDLEDAIRAFKKAEKRFLKAEEISIEVENDVPRMPVF